MKRRIPSSKLGRLGERLAARHLRRRGYRVIARNLLVSPGEADIVCETPDRRALVVVEVKTRRTASLDESNERRPESQVGGQKQRKLRQVAEAVRRKLRASDRPLRIDVIAVTIAPGRGLRRRRVHLRHIQHAVGWS